MVVPLAGSGALKSSLASLISDKAGPTTPSSGLYCNSANSPGTSSTCSTIGAGDDPSWKCEDFGDLDEGSPGCQRTNLGANHPTPAPTCKTASTSNAACAHRPRSYGHHDPDPPSSAAFHQCVIDKRSVSISFRSLHSIMPVLMSCCTLQ